MKISFSLTDARIIVQKMPYNEAQRLQSFLRLPYSPRRRTRLVARDCGSIGALMVADTYSQALSELRRCA